MAINNNEYWSEFSNFIGGGFHEAAYWYSAKTVINYNGFCITFDGFGESKKVYCRFSYGEKIALRIDKRSFINKLINLFISRQKTNDKRFDEQYLVHSPNQGITSILNSLVRRMYLDLDIAGLFISTGKAGSSEEVLFDNNYELIVYTKGIRSDYEYLKEVLVLFKHLVDNLSSRYNITPVNLE
ncbi:hypothetical protein SAMN04488018_10739 [Myroides marinus]|uniref:DUF3137 domain-containing protein n=1 Tax=Myroides marinus TaxID=703342 RepID=A0A1H6UXX7_9FLAO|nr:hypothetical protein [Myroides marinus]SEI92832.1 hypothetical protein SAMN04488018_10739 [Myroides marinus]